MKKYLVEVSSPAATQKYDMLIPDCLQIGEFAKLAGELFYATSGDSYVLGQGVIVCNKLTGEVLNPNSYIRDLGFRNGTKLLLY
jgi:hypothetical protein